jgi:hypothetical protein
MHILAIAGLRTTTPELSELPYVHTHTSVKPSYKQEPDEEQINYGRIREEQRWISRGRREA